MTKLSPKEIANNVEKVVEANKSNEIEAQKSRRKAFYSKAWNVELDPKKMNNQDLKNNMKTWIRQADEERYKSLKPLPKPKKVMPNKIDVPSISEGISKYIQLKSENYYPGAISTEDSISHMPVRNALRPKEETKRSENFGKKVIDPGGITELKGIQQFRNTMEFANEKFPRKLGGGLGPLHTKDKK